MGRVQHGQSRAGVAREGAQPLSALCSGMGEEILLCVLQQEPGHPRAFSSMCWIVHSQVSTERWKTLANCPQLSPQVPLRWPQVGLLLPALV